MFFLYIFFYFEITSTINMVFGKKQKIEDNDAFKDELNEDEWHNNV